MNKIASGVPFMITINSKGGPDWLMFQNNPQRNPFVKSSSVSIYYPESDFGIISPNPASEYIEILPLLFPLREGDLGGGYEIKIYNTFGECVGNYKLRITNYEDARIDISHLPAGVYFVKIGDKYGKFMKE